MVMRLRLRPDVSAAHTDNGLILLDERDGRYWQLNPTATHILSNLLAGATSQQTAELLAGRYPVTTDQAAADITAFLGHLYKAGLVQ
jgi:Coenzyme PQQ synthesis protein D (PqqD)